ncbi:competence type IV pilus minor pilin ComGG [Bacillus sp. V3-13]|uniref:competence type IV pilus minor pilin ComGG n=1 Tax=Bacillus sp. V3-13 TaxID=2053728 RepID=UPI0015E0DAB6|nr:competence type IV pilus minor pilin ComGG [Bacillus sp. V3-13]
MNEHGFTYPLTLGIFLLLSLMLALNAGHFLAEQRLLKETESILEQEYYLMSAVKKVEKQLQSEMPIEPAGTYFFQEGEVAYNIGPVAGSVLQVTFILTIASGIETTSYAYYDSNLKKMTKWVEKN